MTCDGTPIDCMNRIALSIDMPEISDNGATYLCRIRKGIYFAPDPAFRGKHRELVAADYAYSLKRLLDPALKSPWTWLVDGKLVGGDELRAGAAKSGRLDYDTALRTNAEGTGLLMSHCRNAKAFLHMSTCSVYKPNPDPFHLYRETDALGDNESPFSPTYSISKIAAEGVARACARAFDLPTTIARMEVSYGANGGWPAYMFDGMRAGQPVPLQAPGPNLHGPIHEDDICEQAGALLEAASTPAVVVNWAGDDTVSAEDWCTYMGELTGITPEFAYQDRWITNSAPDPTRRQELVGPCRVNWRDGFRRMLAERYPDLLLIA